MAVSVIQLHSTICSQYAEVGEWQTFQLVGYASFSLDGSHQRDLLYELNVKNIR